MWTMYKKELRENAWYALGAFVCVLGIMDFAVHERGWTFLGLARVMSGPPTASGNPLPEDALAWTCVVLAAATALKQVFTERVRRTWALLVQLPLRRELLAYAKMLAGATLILAILLPAVGLLALRLGTPGVWPGPVHPVVFLPLASVFASALALYLAVFVAALSHRWYLRVLVALTAFPPVMTLVNLSEHLNAYGYPHGDVFGAWMWAVGMMIFPAVSIWAAREVSRTREY